MSESELRALISLLDDPDTTIYEEVRDKIISFGEDVIPYLENAWEYSLDHLLQQRVEEIVHHLQFTSLKQELAAWKTNNTSNILAGAILVAKYQYPDLNEKDVIEYVEQIKQDVWLELNINLTALEKIKVINRILFDIHGFNGNLKNINSPQNSFINNVIESKKGNPITLGIIYLAICQRLNIPVYGVNVPAHFVLAFAEDVNDVLFYLNVFNKGSVFAKYDIDKFLEQLKQEPKKEYFIPCDNLTTIKRLIQHLIYTYDNMGYKDKKEELMELLAILS